MFAAEANIRSSEKFPVFGRIEELGQLGVFDKIVSFVDLLHLLRLQIHLDDLVQATEAAIISEPGRKHWESIGKNLHVILEKPKEDDSFERHTTSKMTIPVQTITSFRAAFSPFSPLSRPCRVLLNLLQNPTTTPTNSPTRIDIKVTQLPRNSTQLPEMTIGFKGGKEVKLEVGKRQMKIGDIIEEIARVGRVVEREESLKG